MKNRNSHKVMVSTLALSLLLGGGAWYGVSQYAQAEEGASPSQQSPAADSGHLGKDGAKHAKPWGAGKHGEGEKRVFVGHSVLETAATLLGVDQPTLRESLQSKTLVELAAAKNISEADLIAKLQAEQAKSIDEAVAAGKLDKTKADQLKTKSQEKLKTFVNQKFTGQHTKHHGFGPNGRAGLLPDHDKLAAILGVTKEQLKQELQAGKSIAEIAQSKGIGKDQLIGKIKEELAPAIEKWIDRKPEAEFKTKKQ